MRLKTKYDLTTKLIYVFCCAFLVSSCETPSIEGGASSPTTLKVEPGEKVSFVFDGINFAENVSFVSAQFRHLSDNTYSDVPFSRTTVLDSQSIEHKYAKTSVPSPLDYVIIETQIPGNDPGEMAAFLGEEQPTKVDLVSTLTFRYFMEVLSRPPENLQELNKVSNLIRLGLLSSCFIDENVKISSTLAAERAAINSLLGSSSFATLLSGDGLTLTDVEPVFGENSPPSAVGMIPTGNIGEEVSVLVPEGQMASFRSRPRDINGDLVFARWYNSTTGEMYAGSNIVFDEKLELPQAFWHPKELNIQTNYEDTYKGEDENGDPIFIQKVMKVELRLCDGGALQKYKFNLTVGNTNRSPEIVKTEILTDYDSKTFENIGDQTVNREIFVYQRALNNETTSIIKVSSKDPDGDRLKVFLSEATSENVLLSLSDDISKGIPIQGDWRLQDNTDVSSSAPPYWLESQLAPNLAPSYISFDETNGTAVLENFPADAVNTTVPYERITNPKSGDVGIRFLNVPEILAPVPTSNRFLECFLEFRAANRGFEFYCSTSHASRNKEDFDIRATYECPYDAEREDDGRVNDTCQAINANIENSDGSSDPEKIDADTEFYAYIIIRPDAGQTIDGVKSRLIFDDGEVSNSRITQTGNYDVVPLPSSATPPVFLRLTDVGDFYPETLPADYLTNPLFQKPVDPWYSYQFLHNPAQTTDTQPLQIWDVGRPRTQYGVQHNAWIEGLEWRKRYSSTDALANGLFDSSNAFFLDASKKDALWGRIRFIDTVSNETIRRARVLAHDSNDVFIRVLNLFPDNTNTYYNKDGLCKISNWFTRDGANYPGIDIGVSDSKNNPINNDVRVKCAEVPSLAQTWSTICKGDQTPAADGCVLEESLCLRQDSLSKASCNTIKSSLEGLAFEDKDRAIVATGVTQFDPAIERLLFKEQAGNMNESWYGDAYDSDYVSVQNSSGMNQIALQAGAQNWSHNRLNNFYRSTFYNLIGIGGGWSDENVKHTVTGGEKPLRARLIRQSNSYKPSNNKSLSNVSIDQEKRTIRWTNAFLQASPYWWYNMSRRAFSPAQACRYLVRDNVKSIMLFCSDAAASDQDDAPDYYGNVVTLSPTSNLSKGAPYLDGTKLYVAAEDITANNPGNFIKNGVVALPRRPNDGNLNSYYTRNRRIYWYPANGWASHRSNLAGTKHLIGYHVPTYTRSSESTIPVELSRGETLAFQLRISPASTSTHEFSNGSVIDEQRSGGWTRSYKLVDVDPGEGNTNLIADTAEKFIPDSALQNTLKANIWEWAIFKGKIQDLNLFEENSTEELSFEISTGDTPMNAFVAYRNHNGELSFDSQKTCYADASGWADAESEDPQSLQINDLKRDEFAVLLFPMSWCDNGTTDVTTAKITVKVTDKDGSSSELSFSPHFFESPEAPKVYVYGGGSYSSTFEFNNEGCTNRPRRDDEYIDPYYTQWGAPEIMFPDANGVSTPVQTPDISPWIDGDTGIRHYVRNGHLEAFGRVKRTAQFEGNVINGLQQNSGSCDIQVYHYNQKKFDVAFLKDANSGKYFDPTEGSSNPGFDLDTPLPIDNPEDLTMSYLSSPSAGDLSINYDFPKPSLVPNLFGHWKNTAGITFPTDNSKNPTADITNQANLKHLMFRNPHTVVGLDKAYIAFVEDSEVAGISNQSDIVCDTDVAFYRNENYYDGSDNPWPAPVTPDGENEVLYVDSDPGPGVNKVYVGHFPTKMAPAPSKVNARCFEIKPNEANDWKSYVDGVDDPDNFFDMKFLAYGLGNLLDSTNTADLWCETTVNYGGASSSSNLSLRCHDNGSPIISEFNFNVGNSQAEETFNNASPPRSTLTARSKEQWGSARISILWGDDIFTNGNGMDPLEAPSKVSGVIAADDGTFRTILPFRISAVDQKTKPDPYISVVDHVTGLNYYEGHTLRAEEGVIAHPKMDGVIPLLFALNGNPASPANLENNKLKEDFSNNFSPANNYTLESDRPDLHVEPNASIADPDTGAKFFDMTVKATDSVDVKEDYDGFHVLLRSRGWHEDAVYDFNYTAPYLIADPDNPTIDALNQKDKHAYRVSGAIEGALQFPMTMYLGAASDLVNNIYWDHDNDNQTPEVIWLDQKTTFFASDGAPIIQFASKDNSSHSKLNLIHHEKNLPPCLVSSSFISKAPGSACPSAVARGEDGDADPNTPRTSGQGGNFFEVDGDELTLNMTSAQKANPAGDSATQCTPGDDTLLSYDILEGVKFKSRFMVHDPNYAEGISVQTPTLNTEPYTSPLFPSATTPRLKALTRSASLPKLPGVCTELPIDPKESTSQTEWEIEWTLQDIHIGKTQKIDSFEQDLHDTPVPSFEVKIKDVAQYPKSLSESFKVKAHGWDVNTPPEFIGIIENNLLEANDTDGKFDFHKTNTIIMGAFDPDRGDELSIRLINTNSLGFNDGDITVTSFAENEEVNGTPCRTLIAQKQYVVHSQQPVVCLKIEFKPTNTHILSYDFSVEIEDTPWIDTSDVIDDYDDNAKALYNPKTAKYELSPAQYKANHPDSRELEKSQRYTIFTANAGGEGLLLPYVAMPVAYLNESYSQDFFFLSPSRRDVSCTLTKKPEISNFIQTEVMPALGQSLMPEETMTVSHVATQYAEFSICRITWKPIISYWKDNDEKMDVELIVSENGIPKGTVAYTFNPFTDIDPFNATPDERDGIRDINQISTYFSEYRPQLDDLALTFNVQGGGTDSQGRPAGPETVKWLISYNKADVLDSNFGAAYPLSATWYLNGIPLLSGADTLEFVPSPRDSGVHTITLDVNDGGVVRKQLNTEIFIRNSVLSGSGATDKAEVSPDNFFDAVFDTFTFDGIIGSFASDHALLLGTLNITDMKVFSVKFGSGTPQQTRVTNDISQGHMAVLPPQEDGDKWILGVTNTGGPSKPDGGFYNGSYHAPLYYEVEESSMLSTVYPEFTISYKTFWQNKFENSHGQASMNGLTTSWGDSLNFVLSGHSISTERTAKALWVQRSSDNAVLGHLTFGESASEIIYDFKVYNFNNVAYVVALTESGLYLKNLNSGLAGVDSWDGSNYSPTNVSAGSQWIHLPGVTLDPGSNGLADSVDDRVLGGRIASDNDNRRALTGLPPGDDNKKVVVWLTTEGAKDKVYVFDLDGNGNIDLKVNYQDSSVFKAQAKSLNSSKWPRSRHISYSGLSSTIHITEPNSSLLNSIDVSDTDNPVIRQYALPSANIESLDCHKESDRCFIFDSSNLELWRLK